MTGRVCDIGNLMLTFPKLSPQDFAGWVDAGEAARRNLGVEEYAAKVADQWRAGLAEWDQAPERIARFREAVDIAIYTPGAETGLPLSVLVMMAALPVGSNALIFAQRYHTLQAEATAAIVFSTLAFMLSAPLWLEVLARL